MADLRFNIGTAVMCNLGENGWKLGKVIALNYREDSWPINTTAPYQVLILEDQLLVYVPEDDDRCCREASPEDFRIASRIDALASLPATDQNKESETVGHSSGLGCSEGARSDIADYRSGQCNCCHRCPESWSAAELYSEHYRCATRNKLKITRSTVDLGTLGVGDSINHLTDSPVKSGFMQCPTLVRLPPGIRFSDDGQLTGTIRFDPNRDNNYKVEFVAVSTINWNNPQVGLVRMEVSFVVEGNTPPSDFDMNKFTREQQQARSIAKQRLNELNSIWDEWEFGELGIRDTCDRMCAELRKLRELLETYPRLDGGWWWTQLGGFHMNVHKLLENTLFECELYLGHALTFGDAKVRQMAEMNLEGCYNKRLLEAARFMWIDGVKKMLREEWIDAANTLRSAGEKKDGWGWAVNYGDIWISESAARLIYGVELVICQGNEDLEAAKWITESKRLLELGIERAENTGAFDHKGHPWAAEITEAVKSYQSTVESGLNIKNWLKNFKLRTAFWCTQILNGVAPFPPVPRARLEDAEALIQRFPKYTDL